MKRKITELEQRLIDNGYRLSHKQYGGRKSEKTLSYYYVKQDQFVRLDYKREQVLSLGLLNYHCQELTKMECEGIKLRLYYIEQNIEEQKSFLSEDLGTEIPIEYIACDFEPKGE